MLAGPQWEDETGLVYADVDFADCMDMAASYSRSDPLPLEVQGLDLPVPGS